MPRPKIDYDMLTRPTDKNLDPWQSLDRTNATGRLMAASISRGPVGRPPSSAVTDACLLRQEQSRSNLPLVLVRLRSNDAKLGSLRIASAKPYAHRSSTTDGFFIPRGREDWKVMGEAIASNTILQRLDIDVVDGASFKKIDKSTMREFCKKLGRNRSIKRIELNGVKMYGGEIFCLMKDFILKNPKLSSLTGRGYNLGTNGANLLCSVLRKKKRAANLKYLNLSNCHLGDLGLAALAGALVDSQLQLRSLELDSNRIKDLSTLAVFLKQPKCNLVRLYLEMNRIEDMNAIVLASALTKNSQLKTLSLRGNYKIRQVGYDAIGQALCNSTSLEDMLNSNHRLSRLMGDADRINDQLHFSLALNRIVNKNYVTCRKIVAHLFVYKCGVRLLNSVPGPLHPRIISLIADDQTIPNISGLGGTYLSRLVSDQYRVRQEALHLLIRTCPSLCERHDGPPVEPADTPLVERGERPAGLSNKKLRWD